MRNDFSISNNRWYETITNCGVTGVPSGQPVRLVMLPFSPARFRAFATNSRLMLLVAWSRAINRFRFTKASPATALATCSPIPRSVRRARSAL